MIILSRFKSAVVENGRRILKVLGWGGGALTASECGPFGDDSNPIANLTAIYADTGNTAKKVIIGYVNTQQLAEPGEKRLYAVKADGSIANFIWLKADGQIQLGGTGDHLVKYTPLYTGLTAQDASINSELAKISAALASVGGTYVPASISTDISGSKINTLEVPT